MNHVYGTSDDWISQAKRERKAQINATKNEQFLSFNNRLSLSTFHSFIIWCCAFAANGRSCSSLRLIVVKLFALSVHFPCVKLHYQFKQYFFLYFTPLFVLSFPKTEALQTFNRIEENDFLVLCGILSCIVFFWNPSQHCHAVIWCVIFGSIVTTFDAHSSNCKQVLLYINVNYCDYSATFMCVLVQRVQSGGNVRHSSPARIYKFTCSNS